jgi:UDP-glucose 4-epimerase
MLLVIGGLGFIGTHAAKEFADHGEQVAVTYHHNTRPPELLEELFGGRVTIAPLDMTDGRAVSDTFERLGVDSAVHLLAPPPGGQWSPSEEYRANIVGLLNLLEVAERLGLRRMTIASSIAVYHGLAEGPFREEQYLPLHSNNTTEAFKKAEEILAGHYADRAGLDVVFARLSGIYGPLYHSIINLPARLCHAAVKGRPPNLVRNGVPFRSAEDEDDLCYVKDTVRGLRLLHTAPKLAHRVYNIGNGYATKSRDVLAAVQRAVPGFQAELPPGRSPGSQLNRYFNISRIRSELGFEPQYDIARGIADYIAWLQTHDE